MRNQRSDLGNCNDSEENDDKSFVMILAKMGLKLSRSCFRFWYFFTFVIFEYTYTFLKHLSLNKQKTGLRLSRFCLNFYHFFFFLYVNVQSLNVFGYDF